MAKAVIRWVDGDKVFTPAEFIKHLEGMGIPKDTMGKKQKMVMHLDSKTHYESTYEWEIAGKKFVQHVSCKRDKKDVMFWE
jgi:hypothetical protein